MPTPMQRKHADYGYETVRALLSFYRSCLYRFYMYTLSYNKSGSHSLHHMLPVSDVVFTHNMLTTTGKVSEGGWGLSPLNPLSGTIFFQNVICKWHLLYTLIHRPNHLKIYYLHYPPGRPMIED